jgi:predicted RNase H-like HicB family nuclease
MANYIGLIHKEKKSGYGVIFPDFPGCTTVGNTLDEAHKSAHEALDFHIEGMQEDGEAIPAPSTLEQVLKSDLAKGHSAAIVVRASVKARSLRINVMMDSGVLQRIDEESSNRSAWLNEAAREKLSNSHAE